MEDHEAENANPPFPRPQREITLSSQNISDELKVLLDLSCIRTRELNIKKGCIGENERDVSKRNLSSEDEGALRKIITDVLKVATILARDEAEPSSLEIGHSVLGNSDEPGPDCN